MIYPDMSVARRTLVRRFKANNQLYLCHQWADWWSFSYNKTLSSLCFSHDFPWPRLRSSFEAMSEYRRLLACLREFKRKRRRINSRCSIHRIVKGIPYLGDVYSEEEARTCNENIFLSKLGGIFTRLSTGRQPKSQKLIRVGQFQLFGDQNPHILEPGSTPSLLLRLGVLLKMSFMTSSGRKSESRLSTAASSVSNSSVT